MMDSTKKAFLGALATRDLRVREVDGSSGERFRVSGHLDHSGTPFETTLRLTDSSWAAFVQGSRETFDPVTFAAEVAADLVGGLRPIASAGVVTHEGEGIWYTSRLPGDTPDD